MSKQSESTNSRSNKCCRLLCREFHYSKLCFFHRDWRAFTYTPWLPYKWHFQFVYLLYRWIIALFFLAWLIFYLIQYASPQFLIYLTNWSYLVYVLHHLWSAIVTTYQYFKVHVCCAKDHHRSHIRNSADYDIETPKGCCGAESNGISWFHVIQWILFTIATEMALGVTILFWSLLYNPSIDLDGSNVIVHLVNGIIALVEIWVMGVPVHLLHFVYVQIFATCYAVWTGIYHATNLTNPIDGGQYIYPPLDYNEAPGIAVAIDVLVVLLFMPAIHLFFWLQYVVRYWLVYLIYGRKPGAVDNPQEEEAEIVEMDKSSNVVPYTNMN